MGVGVEVVVDAAAHNGWTALMYATAAGEVGVVDELLAAGAGVDTKNKVGAVAGWRYCIAASMAVGMGCGL